MNDTMQAVVLYGREDARLETVPIPAVGPGEVRVRIAAALTCGTDLKVFRRGYHARMIVPPAIFGHEFAGTVDAVGVGVSEWRIGDRVVAANSAPCGECFYCAEGREELCEELLFLNGAYAGYVTVPERIVQQNLLRVPEHLSFEGAAQVEPLACAVLGVEQTGIRAGETVAIIGAGPMGLLLTRCATLLGARVLMIGRRAERLEAAHRLGAADTLNVESAADPVAWVRRRTQGRGADRVIEAVGRPETWVEAVALVRKGGTVNLFGGCPAGTEVPLDATRMHYDGLVLLASFHHTPRTIRRALQLLAEGHVPPDALIRRRVALPELPDLLPRLARGGGPLKVAVAP